MTDGRLLILGDGNYLKCNDAIPTFCIQTVLANLSASKKMDSFANIKPVRMLLLKCSGKRSLF